MGEGPFDGVVSDFTLYLSAERGFSKHTVEAYLRDVQDFLKNLHVTSVTKIIPEDISKHLAFLKNSQYASTSVLRKLNALRTFFKFLKREGYIDNNIASHFVSPKIWQTLPEVLSIQEMELLLKQPDIHTEQGACFRAVFELMYGAGLRVSEVCSLNLHDVDDTFVKVFGKGGKDRVVPIGKRGIIALDHYLGHFRGECKGSKEPLFVLKGKRLTRAVVYNRIKEYANAAGIKKRISPHTLRHSFATHLLDNGADLRVIQEMMGHANIGSTDRYMHVSRKGIKEKFHACHPRN